MFRRPGSVPPVTRPVPANARRGQQPVVVAGQHRHRPRPGAAHLPRSRRRTGRSTSLPRTSRRSARISPAPAPRQTSPAARIRRARGGLGVGQREVAGDLRRAVRRLGPLAGQRQRPPDTAAAPPGGPMNRRFVRSVRRATPDRPGAQRGEPLDHRRVQQHLRHRLQAQPDRRSRRACPPPTAGSSPAPARPAPPARPRPGRTPPPAATPTTAATAAI